MQYETSDPTYKNKQTFNAYERQAMAESREWKNKVLKSPRIFHNSARFFQKRINGAIPEKIHRVITTTVKQRVRSVLFGANITTAKPLKVYHFKQTEDLIRQRIKFYRSGATIEGAVTGWGGILWGLSDFPLWMALKMKMLFEIAAKYGYETRDYKERLFILYLFQFTFSSRENQRKTFEIISNWDSVKHDLPDDINDFDWKTFQLEYRDFLDLAKLLQLIPGFGAIVGAYVNHKLTDRLGANAMNAYRMRTFSGNI